MTETHHPTFDSSFHTLFAASVIFLNTVLVAVFLIYFLFTPFLLIGLVRVSKDGKSHKFSIPKSTVCVFFLPIYYPLLSLTFHHSPYPITSDDGKLIMMTTIKMINIHLRPNGSGFIFSLPFFLQASPNWFIPYLIYDIIMINLSGCFFIVAAIVLNVRTFWVCFIFFALKLNSAIGVFSLYKQFGGVIDDTSDRVSW